jgi:type I restriction enzyme S subunit
LKAAVEGRLVPTEAELAREEGRDYEPASVLLERILVERRRRWEEAELAKLRAKGKEPKGDAWKANYKEPVEPDTSGLPGLPEGWCWASVDQVMRIVDYRGRTPPYSDGGIPHLRSANVRNGSIVWENLRYVSDETYAKFMTRGIPLPGDILFTTEAPLGECALVPEVRFSVAQRMVVLSPDRELLDSRYLLQQIQSVGFRERVARRKTGSGVAGVSSRNLRPVAVAVAPPAEQRRIIEAVDAFISNVGHHASAIARAVRKQARLRQSILKWAFEGKLVDQDPTDEPAAELLQRIRAERESGQPKKRAARRRVQA